MTNAIVGFVAVWACLWAMRIFGELLADFEREKGSKALQRRVAVLSGVAALLYAAWAFAFEASY